MCVKTLAEEMLEEEAQSFARDEQDLDEIPSLQMHLTLKDDEPVQRSYVCSEAAPQGGAGIPAGSAEPRIDQEVQI